MVRERQSGRSFAFLGACGPTPRRTQARRTTARVSFLIHGPHATRPRPTEYDGLLCLGGVPTGTNAAKIMELLQQFGEIEHCTPPAQSITVYRVKFRAHAAAETAADEAPKMDGLCDYAFVAYKSVPYDDLDSGGEGRGWRACESDIGGELIARLGTNPKMTAALASLPSKMVRLATDIPPEEIKPEAGDLGARVSMVKSRLGKAIFTSQSDAELVPTLYEDYVKSIVGVLQTTLALAGAEAPQLSLPPLPSIEVPDASPLLLADGQLLLWVADAGGEGSSQLGKVQGGRLQLLLAAGDAEVVLDSCSQVVLPWRPPAEGWDAALQLEVKKLVELKTRADALSTEVQGLTLEAVTEKSSEAIQQKVNVLVPALKGGTKADVERVIEIDALRQSVASVISATKSRNETQLSKDQAMGASAEAKQAAAEAVEKGMEGLLQELKRHASETARRVVETPAVVLRATGAAGERRYGSGQWLTIQQSDGLWADVLVSTDGAQSGHDLSLHPWNHAPRELPQQDYEVLREWWMQTLVVKHSDITDALTGKRLDVLQQCVAINMDGAEAAGVNDASSLSNWLSTCHTDRCKGGAVDTPAAALLTGPPAAGKTSLMSQVILQRRLIDQPDDFGTAWNWVDAFVRLEYHNQPAAYRFLRQALLSRRVLLLLDGLDEGGAKRSEIERHVTEVLAPQGHVMLCTSRPAGLTERRFAGFRRLHLSPLTEAQQREALEQRLGGADKVGPLLEYVKKVPVGEDGQRVTSNPLMLSMFASVYELRQGVGMPETVAELYEYASEAMLARGGASSTELRRLMQAIFFEAHVSGQREIEDMQLDESALSLELPEVLASIRKSADSFSFEGRAEKGHYVEVRMGQHTGKRGVITEDDGSRNLYKVSFADGRESGYLKPDQLRSSGMDTAAFTEVVKTRMRPELRKASDQLPPAMRSALEQVRHRVARDELPLFSLLQTEPLRLQSSHLSFQEYFAARALCEEGTRLSGPPPWKWSAWWANAVRLGSEMGSGFGKGLLRAAGVEGDVVDLSGKVGGDLTTAAAVLVAVVRSDVLTSLNASNNKLGDTTGMLLAVALDSNGNTRLTQLDLGGNSLDDQSGKAFGEALKRNATLTQLDLGSNQLGAVSGWAMVEALKSNTHLTSITLDAGVALLIRHLTGATPLEAINLSSKALAEASGIVIAHLVKGNSALTELNVSNNKLGEESGKAFAEVLKTNTKLKVLNLAGTSLGSESGKALATALDSNTTLTQLNVSSNCKLGDESGKAFAEALETNTTLTQLDLGGNSLGDESDKAFAEALKSNATLTQLDLGGNSLGDTSGKAFAEALKSNATLTQLNLGGNNLGGECGQAMVETLKVNAHLASIALDGVALLVCQLTGAEPVGAINLSSKGLGEASGVMIAHLIRSNLVMTQLDLRENKFGDAALQLSAAIIASPTLILFNGIPVKELVGSTITTLDLSNKKIGEAGGQVVAHLITNNSTLKSLSLENNELPAATVKALAEAVKTNTTLKLLNLAGTSLGSDSGEALATALSSNTTLTQLDLGGNSLGDTSGKALAEVLKRNTTLKHLDLGGNQLPAATVKLLRGTAHATLTLAFGNSSESQQCNWCRHCQSQLIVSQRSWDHCQDTEYRETAQCTECRKQLFCIWKDTAEEDGSCFAGEGNVRLAEGGTLAVRCLARGVRVWTPSGSATVLCALRCDVDGHSALLAALPSGGPRLSPGHPVLLSSGRWSRAAALVNPSVCDIDAVYNFVLSSGHILEIDGWLCVTLGDGRSDLREQLGPSPFSSPAAAAHLVRASAGCDEGRITKSAFRRGDASLTASRQADIICAFLRLPAHERTMSPGLLCTLHHAAMQETDVSSEMRCDDNERVTIGKHTPVVGPAVGQLAEAFCKLTDDAWHSWAAHDLAAFALWWVNHVHPFRDGNGRTARSVAFLILCEAGVMASAPAQLHRFHLCFEEAATRREYVRGLSLADSRAAATTGTAVAPLASTVAELALLLQDLCSREAD